MIEELPEGEEFRDEEFPDENSSEGDATVACRSCGERMYDDAEKCPHCGDYVTSAPKSSRGYAMWIMIGVAALVLGLWAIRR